MLLSVEVPVTTAVTMPPPAVPVVSMTAISSCALSMFSCIFCACFIIACMFMPPPKPPKFLPFAILSVLLKVS